MSLMKLALSALLLVQVSLALPARADTDSVTGLKFVMKDMGAQFKTLFDALVKHQPTTQEALQAAADKIIVDAKSARGRLPDELVDTAGQPLPDKQDQIKQFTDIMDQLIAAAGKLSDAIRAGDNDTATTLLNDEMTAIRKNGHDLFKPQE